MSSAADTSYPDDDFDSRRGERPGGNDYSGGLSLSVVLHIAAIGLVLIKSVYYPDQPILYVPTLRVDLVGLPDLLKKDIHTPKIPSASEINEKLKEVENRARTLKPPPVKSLAPVEPAKPDEMVLKPKRVESQAEKAKEEKNREHEMKAVLERMNALNRIRSEEDTPQVIKGNKISKGTSVSGDAKESNQASYYDSIRDRLRDNWEISVWLERQQLSAKVKIFIDRQGRVTSMLFVKPSGNAQFDEAVKRAVTASQPFPTPPDAMVPVLLANGVLFGFPL